MRSSVGGSGSAGSSAQEVVTVRVDVRKLYRVISWASRVFRKIVFCIASGSTIVFSGKSDDLQITYYVPILC